MTSSRNSPKITKIVNMAEVEKSVPVVSLDELLSKGMTLISAIFTVIMILKG